MEGPEFLLCLECETPCYTFEWRYDRLEEVLCEVCGNEDPDSFISEEDYDAMVAAKH